MTVFLYLPIVLSLLVLGAHFLRYDNMVGVIAAIVLIGLLFLRKAQTGRPNYDQPYRKPDIPTSDFVLTGGGALLGELDLALREQTGLAISVADESLNCVAMGTGKALEYEKQLRHVIEFDN